MGSMKLRKILKWVGILALISLPIFLFTKKKESSLHDEAEEENNIFEKELIGSERE